MSGGRGGGGQGVGGGGQGVVGSEGWWGQGCLGGVSRCHLIDQLPKFWLLHYTVIRSQQCIFQSAL